MSTRSSTRNKRKHESNNKRDVSLIPYNATCVSENISISIACSNCKSKLEGKYGFGRNRQPKKTNIRHISKRNKCEQRWTLDYVLTKNASTSRYQT